MAHSPTSSSPVTAVDPDPFGLVAMLMASPSQLAKIRQAHAPDASGHCRSCRAGGASSGRVRECSLWVAACEAKRRLAESKSARAGAVSPGKPHG